MGWRRLRCAPSTALDLHPAPCYAIPMMTRIFKGKQRGGTAPVPSQRTLSDALALLEQSAQTFFQESNLILDPEERMYASGQGAVLWNFVSHARAEAEMGLCDLSGDLSQGWALDSIASQYLILRSGDAYDTPGAVPAHLSIISALEGKLI